MEANKLKESTVSQVSDHNNKFINKESSDNLNPENNQKTNGKKRNKSKKSKNGENKPHPPERRVQDSLSSDNGNNNSGRNLNNNNNHHPRNKEELNSICDVIKKKVDKFYFKYIYLYKAQTQNELGLKQLKERNCSFIRLFLSKFIPHSTFFFILPFNLCTKKDSDNYFIKLVVLILYLGL